MSQDQGQSALPLGRSAFRGQIVHQRILPDHQAESGDFVTPRIIDPAGNQAHLDEEMPFLGGVRRVSKLPLRNCDVA